MMALLLAACSGGSHEPAAPAPEQAVRPANAATSAARDALAPALVDSYARRLAPMVVGRSLSAEESARLAAGGAALPALIEGWTAEPGFPAMARDWVATTLKASGQRGDMNLELPGNLAAHLAGSRRPHAELLTADYCIDNGGARVACDTGAPFAAGVLATRAFLSANASRYNLKRARTVLRTFGCKDYPLPAAEQPPLARDALIPLFQRDLAEGANNFGNGTGCYTCHSQFGAHAQPFVKFDTSGRWIADASGQQGTGVEQGRSSATLFASHLAAPDAARNEASQIFGRQVSNLAGMARAYAESPGFLSCSTGSLIGYAFGLPESVVFSLPADVMNDIVAAARLREAQPSLAALAIEAFSHPAVVRSFEPVTP
jgi:hypothetical protein